MTVASSRQEARWRTERYQTKVTTFVAERWDWFGDSARVGRFRWALSWTLELTIECWEGEARPARETQASGGSLGLAGDGVRLPDSALASDEASGHADRVWQRGKQSNIGRAGRPR